MTKNFSFEGPSKFAVVRAEEGMQTENCLVIKEGQALMLVEIVSAAVQNKAFEKNIDEGGDDTYVVQFPGDKQKRMSKDQITAKLRELSGEDGE